LKTDIPLGENDDYHP